MIWGRAILVVLCMGCVGLVGSPPAQADFGFLPGEEGFDVSLDKKDGSAASQAGEHPYTARFSVGLETAGGFADGDLRDLHLELPSGLLVNPTAVGECTQTAFHTPRSSPFETSLSGESCPDQSQVGMIAVTSSLGTRYFGLFALASPYGAPGAFGASPYGVSMIFVSSVRDGDAGLTLDLEGLAQGFDVQDLEIELWGTPWAYEHDGQRGNCLNEQNPVAYHGTLAQFGTNFVPGTCTIGHPAFILEKAKSYVTLPTTPCGEPMSFTAKARSWQEPDEIVVASAAAHDAGGDPTPLSGCNKHLTVPKVQLTSERAAAGTGFVFKLGVSDGGGILNPGGIARPAIKQAVISLPEGLTINPSLGSGLRVCTEAEFGRETVDSSPGEGCPNASKIGTVEVQGMLGLSESLHGDLFLARPYENPYGALIALYITARSAERGLFAKSVGKVVPAASNGRLTITFDQLPRLLYTNFELTLREGQRSAMVSPPACGDYATDVALASWADPETFSRDASSFFPISQGPSGDACPNLNKPFAPGLEAGSLNVQAGSYTPYHLRMTRSDDEQEITSYSATFPPGLLGRIAGVPFCPDAAIEAARGRTGLAELRAPSCPAASSIGHTIAGYGVGGALAYAPGGLYLAGPYRGAPLSVVAIDSALVGPFDLGVVIVRSAIRVDPRTAQVSIDSIGSDPIPHILFGIPLHLRDIRVYVDRPNFTITPTNCDPLQSLSMLTGAGLNLFGSADDSSATSTDRYQVLNCLALGFKPRFSLRLKGGTKRGRYPALRAVYTPRPGEANVGKAVVTLPKSLFLAQEHIGTVCTAPQLAAQRCPANARLGTATAITPLLDEPLTGPVYARSSSSTLPDIVADLRGRGVNIQVQGGIDSGKGGGLRASFQILPDAPVTKFTMSLSGGERGLLVNSENLCAARQLATARFIAQDNATLALRPKLAVPCKGKGRKRR